MRQALRLFGVSVFVVAMTVAMGSCGGDDDGGGGGSCNVPTGMTGSADTDCFDCVKANCNSEYSSMLGSGWQSGNFSGGACSDWWECNCDCGSNQSCVQGCISKLTGNQACLGAVSSVSTCVQNKCNTQCQ